ncbi:hypothetical protein A9995_13285 [Erythrobacter sp. QSSC1-22B]|uniref:hypothetical protein n=1 Tax=Erythrobacter sp. QSSC1-22B TaxID=1860125 RepID=UPI000805BCD5|nr:hypothetical protein [Erythrobacter sp. QSSC1-22B]OBX18129.1 hypothetical protein A9995_13285 [Erythrobacter sp. QSSC1-22B]
MIDYFALALTHGLLLIALLRLIGREDVDIDPPVSDEEPEPVAPAQPPVSGAAARRAARKRRRNA